MKDWFKLFVHSSLVHPLLPFMPKKVGDRFHDWNARWAFDMPLLGKEEGIEDDRDF